MAPLPDSSCYFLPTPLSELVLNTLDDTRFASCSPHSRGAAGGSAGLFLKQQSPARLLAGGACFPASTHGSFLDLQDLHSNLQYNLQDRSHFLLPEELCTAMPAAAPEHRHHHHHQPILLDVGGPPLAVTVKPLHTTAASSRCPPASGSSGDGGSGGSAPSSFVHAAASAAAAGHLSSLLPSSDSPSAASCDEPFQKEWYCLARVDDQSGTPMRAATPEEASELASMLHFSSCQDMFSPGDDSDAADHFGLDASPHWSRPTDVAATPAAGAATPAAATSAAALLPSLPSLLPLPLYPAAFAAPAGIIATSHAGHGMFYQGGLEQLIAPMTARSSPPGLGPRSMLDAPLPSVAEVEALPAGGGGSSPPPRSQLPPRAARPGSLAIARCFEVEADEDSQDGSEEGSESPEPVAPRRACNHKAGGPCNHCGVTESPQWRRGPPNKPVLCNACGTRLRRTQSLGSSVPSSSSKGGGRGGGSAPGGGGKKGGGSKAGSKRGAAAQPALRDSVKARRSAPI